MLRRLLLFLVPFAMLGGTAIYLHLQWSEIPARFPVHWSSNGTPNGWSTRTTAGVYGPLVLGGMIVAMQMALFAGLWSAPRRRARAGLSILIAVAYVIGAAFSMAGLLPLYVVPEWGLLAFFAAALGSIGIGLWRTVGRGGGEVTPDASWRAGGQFHYALLLIPAGIVLAGLKLMGGH